MTTVIGIAGSLRRNSLNKHLLSAAAELMPEGTTLEIASIADFPLFNEDVEKAGFPAAVAALKDRIAAADGLLLATPEYNNGIPGVFKNAIDWLSRPPADIPRVFRDKPVAVMGASPGRFGTLLSQNDWLAVLRTLGTRHYTAGRLTVSEAGKLFDGEGQLTDEKTRERLGEFLAGFVGSL